jgi:endosialidase-like protein
MNLFRSTTTTPIATNSIHRSPLRRSLLFIPLALGCFALGPLAQAQLSPPPDGGYANANTAEGDFALRAGTAGINNSAFGFAALANNQGSYNTGIGSAALYVNSGGNFNTATGFAALYSNGGSDNTANGFDALNFNTFGGDNTADGFMALFRNDLGTDNTAVGSQTLFANTGSNNTGIGSGPLFSNGTGNDNTAVGFEALISNTTGSNNIALGSGAGSALGTGAPGDDNIEIGNDGGGFDTGTIRIGTQGTQGACFIAGIAGVLEDTPIAAVTINANGQLGTAPSDGIMLSSRRFKKEIKPMDKTSEAILQFKPVTFRYKNQDKGTPQFGLIAEEVAEVNPDLVTRDENGEPYSVRYEAVNAMLLNEFLKEHQKVQRLEAALAAVNKRLKAQDAKIDKVNAKVELTKPAPQTVLNNQ